MEEEPEIQEPTTVEEQLNTETSKPTKLNKNGQPRKPLTPEAKERLAKNREKANAIRKQISIKKLEEKVEKLKSKNEEVTKEKELKEEPQEKELKEEPEEVVEKKVKPKEKGKKKTKIIVEQSSDDSDQFEPNDHVVFVKRVSRKKKEVPIVPEPEPQMELPPPEPPKPPQPPPLSRQQKQFNNIYENMSSGAFLRNRFY